MSKTKEEVRTDGKAVFYAVLWPSMRKAALENGYALCLHGSMARDMDIVAVPWVENASSVETLVVAISDCIDGTVWKDYHTKKFEYKPHGRISYTLAIMGDWSIDLGVITPSSTQAPSKEKGQEELWEEVKETLKLAIGLDPYRCGKIVAYLEDKFTLIKK